MNYKSGATTCRGIANVATRAEAFAASAHTRRRPESNEVSYRARPGPTAGPPRSRTRCSGVNSRATRSDVSIRAVYAAAPASASDAFRCCIAPQSGVSLKDSDVQLPLQINHLPRARDSGRHQWRNRGPP